MTLAKINHLILPAHYNIYTGENDNRELEIYFSEPDDGVNEETGILLLIPGFGGNVLSNVYKKMRSEFADKHNLIVIQTNYFGSEYMQSSSNINLSINLNEFRSILNESDYNEIKNEGNSIDKVVKILSNYSCVLKCKENMKETIASFNDMGFMQAMDILTALYAVKIILQDNNLTYNKNKVIAYGHSHGAYLAYLCNRIAPYDFSLIVDNSAWLKPVYLSSSRYLRHTIGDMVLQIQFDYLAKNLEFDKNILNLFNLYDGFNNNAEILSFHGKTDKLVNYEEKDKFCRSVENNKFYLIDESKVDNKKFYSTGHGLRADFIKHFDFVMENVDLSRKVLESKNMESVVIESDYQAYTIDYKYELPIMIKS